MKITTFKYWRLYCSIARIENIIENLNWNQYDKLESLKKELKEKNIRLEKLSSKITQKEFEEYLSENMCCTWEDFKL